MAMKCPGCGTELADGSDFCDNCGGMIIGTTIDYSQKRKRISDVYEDTSFEPLPREESLDGIDGYWADLMSFRFVMAMFALPFLTFVTISVGLLYDRIEYLLLGVFFLALTVLTVFLSVKYKLFGSRGAGDSRSQEKPTPLMKRRL